jgi:hypothetical protein
MSNKERRIGFSAELGELYYSRMLRFVGIKQYESQLTKLLEATTTGSEEAMLTTA